MLKLKVLSTQNVFILPNDTANELLSLYPDDYELLEGAGVNKGKRVKKKEKDKLLKNSVITENLPKISSSILHLILDI